MRKLSTTIFTITLLLLSLLSYPTKSFYASRGSQLMTNYQQSVAGDWTGTLSVGDVKLHVILHVTQTGQSLTASLDSPDQGATGLKIDTINLTQNSLAFEMNALGVTFSGLLSSDGEEIRGEWKQQGQSLPLTFVRRPATPDANALKLQKVDAGGHGLNLLIGGIGSPTVILEGGFGEGIAGWTTVQRQISTFTRVVSYDRAGQGQSDQGPKPRTAKQIAKELHSALEKAGVKPPYVLVGHSLGGIYVRVFADLFPQEVAGLVLVDPSQESIEEWIKKSGANQKKEEEEKIAKAPAGVQAEYAALDATYSQVRGAKVPSGIPVTLLTAGRGEGMPEEARKVWSEKQKEWLASVPGGKLVVAEKSGHLIQFEQPELVIDTVKQVIAQAKK